MVIDGEETYCYNERNELTERKTLSAITKYLYDENGSLVSEKEGERKTSYQYDLLNRQTHIKMPDGREQENFYDGEGLRAGISEDGKAFTFLFLNGEILAECDGNSMPVRRHLSGLGLSHVQTLKDDVYHSYYQDEQGSTAYITGGSGAVENSYCYDAFGNVLESREDISNRILYTGQQYDQETGQYYLRARFYNPVVGRFTQEDTYRGDGLNLYAYCANNPVMYYDPSGHGCDDNNQKKNDKTPTGDVEGKANSQRYEVSDSRREHILEGNPPGTGHGPNRGNIEGAFPDTWTDDQAIDAIERVANSPDSTWKQATGSGYTNAPVTTGGPDSNAPLTTNSGNPVRFKVQGQDHGLNIEVIVEPSGEGIITGYVK